MAALAFLPRLLGFAAELRRAGFTVGPAEVADALRAAEGLGLLEYGPLEAAWGVVFARTRDQAQQFPPLFRAYFLDPAAEPRPDPAPGPSQEAPGEESGASERGDAVPLAGEQRSAEEGEEAGEPGQNLHARLSPHAGQGAPLLPGQDETQAYAEAARALLRGVRLGRSRRRRTTVLGRQVDVRATLQAAGRTGGEPLRLRYRARPPRPPRVLLLLDGSRSMAPYAALLLRYAAALSARSRKVEVYSFSTSLVRLTPLLRAGQAAVTGEGWGGGTRIGENLQRLRRAGKAALRPDTLLVVLSDGLETGEPQHLAEALRHLRARVGGVVWLNPLAAQPGYQPLARGMAAALPHLDVFAGVEDVDDLLALPGKVRRALR
ncbi:VWA domain-containing protein [Deinococcus irradiatisoli]|uniref:VWA domain-containing protein n=1 Tax=Deinococcus irradiatisoli TaxID=2202254 RepID=UPI0015E8581F|nr:VWA domain-containing protein [Deinococcus irradiatisoli]